MVKFLFLDVDGVLCLGKGENLHLDALHQLTRLVRKTSVSVVLSSSWRLHPQAMAQLNTAFRMQRLQPIYSSTPDLGHEMPLSAEDLRVHEILAWLTAHSSELEFGCLVESWVIVDDLDLSIPLSRRGFDPLAHFVHVDSTIGLSAAACSAIEQLLDSQL